MKFIRQNIIKTLLIAFWCLALFNMSFYFIEIKALKADHKSLIENAKRLLAASTEEEDAGQGAKLGGSILEEDAVEPHQHSLQLEDKYKRLHQQFFSGPAANLLIGHYETFSPPPEI